MKTFQGLLIIAAVLAAGAALGVPHYVSPTGTNNSPYLTWPDAATNIQWAVNVAANGETVWVTNGTYTLTNQIVITNGITVQSCNGKTLTFINGNYPAYSNRCFYLSNTAAVVDGFTITNGCLNSDSWLGGGVALYAGTMRNCSIMSNMLAGNANASGYNGVYMTNASVLSNCFIGYHASSGYVGGVTFYAGSRVDQCRIVSNSAVNYGGIWGYGTIVNSTCEWNFAKVTAGYGGGMIIDGLVSNCVFNKNTVDPSAGWCQGAIGINGGLMINSRIQNSLGIVGGILIKGMVVSCVMSNNYGVGLSVSGGTVSNCWIVNNTPYGGLLLKKPNPIVVRNCLVANNSRSTTQGGGIQIETTNYFGVVENCTIVGNNSYANYCGGVSVLSSGNSAIINNCIIYSNDAQGVVTNWYIAPDSTAYFTNCCTTSTNDLPGSGNITNNPAFVNYGAKDYRLRANSPCINKGMNQAWMTDALDLDGKRRADKFSGQVDMGCYEFLTRGMLFGFR